MTQLHHPSDLSSEISNEIREVRREYKHFLRFKDENHLLFTAFVIVMCSLLVINTLYLVKHSSGKTAGNQTGNTLVSDTVLTSLQAGRNRALSVKISNVTENSQTDYAFASDPDSTMLILEISITNQTSQQQQLIPVSQFYVRTNEGETANLHASMYVTHPLAATELAPNKTAKGQLSFSIPKRIAHPFLYIDTGWANTIPIVYDVLR